MKYIDLRSGKAGELIYNAIGNVSLLTGVGHVKSTEIRPDDQKYEFLSKMSQSERNEILK